MQLRVAAGVHGDLKQRHEDVLQHLLEVAQLLAGVIDITAGKGGGHIKGRPLLLQRKYVKEPFKFRYNNRNMQK